MVTSQLSCLLFQDPLPAHEVKAKVMSFQAVRQSVLNKTLQVSVSKFPNLRTMCIKLYLTAWTITNNELHCVRYHTKQSNLRN